MHPNEAATIRAFIALNRRDRWLDKLAGRHRRSFLDRLNHCHDFDERHGTALAATGDALAMLRSRGAPLTCRIISDEARLDERAMPLDEAIAEVEVADFGTLICCIPGRLAYYRGEAGTQWRLLLERLDTA